MDFALNPQQMIQNMLKKQVLDLLRSDGLKG